MIGFREGGGSPLPSTPPAVELADRVFAPTGWLARRLGLEHRPQQEAMAQAVARAMATDTPLVFEAGTGVGKSLAYLVPGILQAVSEKRPLLVSSHTIALQQQLKNHDIPLVRRLFDQVPELEPFRGFRVALMVGRGNYLCGHRLARAIQTRGDLFNKIEAEELERICEWSTQTKTGLREELAPAPSPEVWEWVNADGSSCNSKNCSPETCFYRRALAERAQAQVVIVNHSLLFSLISAGLSPAGGARGVLFPDDFLVLDEAHTVPEIATNHCGLNISSYAIERALKILYNPKTKKGLLSRLAQRADQESVVRAISASESFFNAIRRQYLDKRDVLRLLKPDWTDPLLHRPLGTVTGMLKRLRQDITDEGTQQELTDHAQRLDAYLKGITHCLTLQDEGEVYWLEKTGRRRQIVTLRTAPVDVAEFLRETLFEKDTSITLASATLTSGRTMAPFLRRTGAEGEETGIEASPFDYENHVEIAIAEDAPGPDRTSNRLDISYLAEMIGFCSLRTEGGTLGLFTSYADLNRVATQLAPVLEKAGRPLLWQGMGLSRSELKNRFVEAGNAVLLGTESFWTGFDVPGPALSQVVITRLPFEIPTHPVAEARAEWIRKRGGNPFAEMTLPEAVIQFRQGIGRLIRKQDDRGRIVILDSRILQKEYGRHFIEALPKRHFTRFNRHDREGIFGPS
ncbi:ATP-dependent DNA helicase [Ruficoccus amylovorans]|uniref:ATP-dependent DNA helicase n=1 Tax=Ruficoccus amylovorans TaxID=1804625 RepID=A0A842HCA5_9BACT|nr:helicase C-terminal domain-containing protein [Ruficoccus amylovorans]MBC2593698.1 ATP-dependent DNA helicase [Ruficoccus amylovorans]